jgi:phage gpG-like protein
MYKDVMNNFAEEEDEEGRRWPRWFGYYGSKTRKYYDSRPYANYKDKMLQNTGTLRNSVQFESRKDEAKVYTIMDYAKYHQFGTKNMVKRPFMYIPKDKQFEYITLFKAFLFQ